MQEEQRLLSEQESYFLNTFPLIRHITKHKLRGVYREQAEDLVQKIGLNLWRWRLRRATNSEAAPFKNSAPGGQSVNAVNKAHDINDLRKESQEQLTQDAWLKIANTATQHEVSSFYRSKYRREAALAEVLTAQITETGAGNISFATQPAVAVEGNSRAEVASLLCRVWEIIDGFPLTRKYSYLLGKEELLINFITHGCVTRKEIAASLGITVEDLDNIIRTLPVPDESIREMLEKRGGVKISLRQIWTWRAKAKARLADQLRNLL